MSKALLSVVLWHRQDTIDAFLVIQTACLLLGAENASHIWTLHAAILLQKKVLQELEVSSIKRAHSRRTTFRLVQLVVTPHLTKIVARCEKGRAYASLIQSRPGCQLANTVRN